VLPSAGAILEFLEANATQILIQSIDAGRRRKNRVIVGFRRPDGTADACGGLTIRHAVARAQFRVQAANAAKGGK
jgi:hypothetical protein